MFARSLKERWMGGVSFWGNYQHTLDAKNRLFMLNVYVGAQVTLVRRAPFGGGVMLEAGGVRLAADKKLAEKE